VPSLTCGHGAALDPITRGPGPSTRSLATVRTTRVGADLDRRHFRCEPWRQWGRLRVSAAALFRARWSAGQSGLLPCCHNTLPLAGEGIREKWSARKFGARGRWIAMSREAAGTWGALPLAPIAARWWPPPWAVPLSGAPASAVSATSFPQVGEVPTFPRVTLSQPVSDVETG
jgi:hypothetical protein